MLQLLNWKED